MSGSDDQAARDRAEIAHLLSVYQHTADRDRSRVPGLFTPDGEFHGIDGSFVGAEALAAFFTADGTRGDTRKYRGGMHIVSPPHVEVDGDSALAWSTVLYVTAHDGPATVVFAGEYNDTLRRVDGRWLLAVRRVTALTGNAAPKPDSSSLATSPDEVGTRG